MINTKKLFFRFGIVADGHCRRLPGLWLICVFFGLCAAFYFLWIPSTTWLGRVVFSAFTIGFLLAAGALWTRRQWAPIVAKVVWFACLLWLCVLIFPSIFLIFPIGAWLPASVILFGYLRWRKKYFQGTQPPSFTSPVSIIAMAIVTLFFCLSLIHNIDDPLMEFAELEMGVQKAVAEENGYVAFERIVEEELFTEPEGVEQDDMHWSWIRMPGDKKFEKWLPVARNMLEKNTEYLKALNDLLKRPYFILPHDEIVESEVWEMNSKVRNAARVLAAHSIVKLADGNATEALDTSLNTYRLGLKWAGGYGGQIEYLSGQAVMEIGLANMRSSAGADGMEVASLRTAVQEIDTTEIQNVYSTSLRTHFQMDKRELKELSSLPDLIYGLYFLRLTFPEMMSKAFEGELEHTAPKWLHVFVADSRPLYKPNMTVNRAGARTLYIHQRLDNTEVYSELDPEQETTLQSYIRNPLGNVLHEFRYEFRAVERYWKIYWKAVASIRVTKTYLALRAYHLESGELPETLEELVDDYLEELPKDPFTGETLGYKPDSERPVVYSVGTDGRRPDPDEPYGWDNITLKLEFMP